MDQSGRWSHVKRMGEVGADGLGGGGSRVSRRPSNHLGYCGDELLAIPDGLELLGNGVLFLWGENRRGDAT